MCRLYWQSWCSYLSCKCELGYVNHGMMWYHPKRHIQWHVFTIFVLCWPCCFRFPRVLFRWSWKYECFLNNSGISESILSKNTKRENENKRTKIRETKIKGNEDVHIRHTENFGKTTFLHGPDKSFKDPGNVMRVVGRVKHHGNFIYEPSFMAYKAVVLCKGTGWNRASLF